MAKYTISWIEAKNPDWKTASLIGEDKTAYQDVSINRTSKKGEAFPNFDGLMNGGEAEGEIWQSAGGKWYLFPPKPQTTPSGAPRGSGGGFKAKMIDEAMAKKEQSIGRFQASKEESIRLASAQRDSVLVVVHLYKEIAEDPIMTPSEKDSAIKKKILELRDWFLSDEFQQTLPFSEDGTK